MQTKKRYYKITVVFLVEAGNVYYAQQRAIKGNARLWHVTNAEQAPEEVEATISKLIQSQPEKGLW